MQAELVMVGTELLLGEIVDTNAQWLATRLANIGVDVFFKTTVGDNWVRMASVLTQALNRADLVIVSGGLGPTQDDITRQVIAGVTGHPLQVLPAAENHVRNYFQHTARPMPESVLRQALFPQGAQPIANERGTALGMLLEHGRKTIIALPGVPSEFKGMVEQSVLPYLVARQGVSITRSRVLHFFGLGESAMEELVRDLIDKQTNPTIAPYAGAGEARLRITARAGSEAEAWALIDPVEQEVRRRGERYIYGVDDANLEQVVGEMLLQRHETLATAESCTGGLIASRVTDIPGSSSYFQRGWVTYSNDAKVAELSVPADVLSTHGAVSAPVALAMAKGARLNANTTYALAVTGIAGPGGGTEKKPVGLVFVGLAGPGNSEIVNEFHFRGYRADIKTRTASSALNMLRLHLMDIQ